MKAPEKITGNGPSGGFCTKDRKNRVSRRPDARLTGWLAFSLVYLLLAGFILLPAASIAGHRLIDEDVLPSALQEP